MMRSETAVRAVRRVCMQGLAVLLLLGMAGCDADDDVDHDPPAGQGSMVVDNRTVTDINVYVDGSFVGRVRDFDDRIVDLAPGIHRLVLDQRDGDRYRAEDADILAGRLTVVTVRLSGDIRAYDTSVRLE